VTDLQQTVAVDATICCHFVAVSATCGPLQPCCNARHASLCHRCGASGDVLGQVADMKLGLQPCYGIRSNGNKPAEAKTSACTQKKHVRTARCKI
jgi:hypothetical protein